jgi:MscS family membrane protein
VPNGEFSQLQLENFARRDRIRFATVLGLRYDTPAKALRQLLKALQAHLAKHPHLDRKLPHRVNFIGLGSSSLDVELFCYFKTADWDEFLLWREQLLLELMDHVAKAGAALALPTHAQVEEPRRRRRS